MRCDCPRGLYRQGATDFSLTQEHRGWRVRYTTAYRWTRPWSFARSKAHKVPFALDHAVPVARPQVMGNLYAVRGAFIQQWRMSVRFMSSLSFAVYSIQITAIVAWVATQNGDPAILSYIALGVPLMVIWDGYISGAGPSSAGKSSSAQSRPVWLPAPPSPPSCWARSWL